MATVRHESELLTPAEAAIELRTTAATVKRWLRTGALPGVKLPGGDWRIAIEDLRALRVRHRNDRHQRDETIDAREPV